ncbi:hypothetical protein FD754_023426 [Muntiacus muntjak]|uniref:Mos1 transposase HTH domain-containing protein n=1 Tax=Muntiacus muntjak TaxID=9888 RepID=A0A5N3UU59_MUNMU|nr:hypothetical protein FD754_023426 [Muntiacus muntjak]
MDCIMPGFPSREMMLDKKQIRAIFLFEFKVSHKAAVTTHSINNAFGPGTANEHTMQWWFKKFCRDKSLEDEEHSGWLSEVDSDRLRVPHELPINQKKNHCFEVSSSLILYYNNEPLLDWIVTCNEKWIYITTGDGHLSGWTENKLQSTSQSQTCTQKKKKVLVTVWWSTACLIHYRFLNPKKTITSEKMGLVLLHDNAQPHATQSLPHQSYSTPDLSSTDYQFFKHLDNFLQGKCFHNQQEAENTSQEFSESQKAYFTWQKCVDCNGSYFD